jgi:hypothetical protein
MRIVIKYATSQRSHMIDLSADELYQLQNSSELLINQEYPIKKNLHVVGNPNELELLANALLSRAKELRQQKN